MLHFDCKVFTFEHFLGLFLDHAFVVVVVVVFAVAAVIVIVWPVVNYNESNNISSMLNTPMFTVFARLIDVQLH